MSIDYEVIRLVEEQIGLQKSNSVVRYYGYCKKEHTFS